MRRAGVSTLALAASMSLAACREYTCVDTATCEPPALEAGRIAEDGGELSPGRGAADASSTLEEVSDEGSRSSPATNSVLADSGAPTGEWVSSADFNVSTGAGVGLDASAPGPSSSHPDAGALQDGETTTASHELTSDRTGDTTEPPEVWCDPSKPFGRPFAIASVNLDGVAENVMISPDGLTLHVRYGTDPTTYVAQRESLSQEFGTPNAYSAFEQVLEDNPLLQLRAITEDGLTAYLSEDWANAQPIRSVRREALSETFGQLVVHEEFAVSTPSFDVSLVNPWVNPTGERVYGFLPAAYSLWVASLQDFGFEAPSEVLGVGNMTSFVLSSSERVVYYGVHQGAHHGRILRAERSGDAVDFGPSEEQAALDGTNYDTPLWVSDDDCQLVLMQEQEVVGENVTYTSDIFIARRGL